MNDSDSPRMFLITNPGSSSRKYALYRDDLLICSLYFEIIEGKLVCSVSIPGKDTKTVDLDFDRLEDAANNVLKVFAREGVLNDVSYIDAVLIRMTVPGEYFTHDHLVDDEYLARLELAHANAPLHVPVAAGEIRSFIEMFGDVKVIAISDSEFHNTRPNLTKYYAFNTKLADEMDVKKFGYHGLSVGAVTNYMKNNLEYFPSKIVVCHLGSGCSATAVLDGKSLDTTMGYTPLDGMMMATRTGDISVAAATAIQHYMKYENTEDLEKYLNGKCGLLGVSNGQSSDMRDIIRLRNEGDINATMAHGMFVYRVQSAIGQMTATLGGIDALVFTGTIGERSDEIRHCVVQKMSYLGFAIDESKNISEQKDRIKNIAAEGSKPIYVVKTDEFGEMVRQAQMFLAEVERND